MKPKTKKIIILCSMIALLIATGVLNWYLNTKLTDNLKDTDADITEETFFQGFRSDRESVRQEAYVYLDSIIASENSSAEAKAAAEAQKLAIVTNMENELMLEGLIKAKGFEDCVVSITASNINVVVMSEELTSDQLTQIISIIVDETDYSPGNVKIIPYTEATAT